MEDYIDARIKRARHLLETHGVDAVVITSTANFFFFTETWINPHERLLSFVIRKTGDPVILAPKMHENDMVGSSVETLLWNDGENAMALLAKCIPEKGVVSIDSLWPSQNLISLMRHRPQLTFIDSTRILGELRLRKDQHELALLRKAGEVADGVMQQIIAKIVPGMREIDVVEELKNLWTKEGVDEVSFNPIIGAGANGAQPHHQSGQTTIKSGDMVVIDMGGVINHYCSDMTRTIAIGEVTPQMKDVYEVVHRAHEAGAKAVKPGVLLGEIDHIARTVIKEAGYGSYFIHRTGHGLGIEVHEEPYVYSGNQQPIETGMVFSIEPGIYLPGQFGVRIEDIVIATETNCESFNNFTKELLVV